MADLPTDQQRYLAAAFGAIPQDWFRPRVVGRELAFSEQQCDSIVQSLAAAGMLTAHPEHCVRLTDQGRKQAAHVPDSETQPAGRRTSLMIMACSAALVAVVFGVIWWAGIL